jgi:hypothetical protein
MNKGKYICTYCRRASTEMTPAAIRNKRTLTYQIRSSIEDCMYLLEGQGGYLRTVESIRTMDVLATLFGLFIFQICKALKR